MKRIIIQDLSKSFRGTLKEKRITQIFSKRFRRRDKQILKRINLEVEEGELLGIIGENGCGKTTLLRIISGIYKKREGRIRTRGRIISLINLKYGVNWRLTMEDAILFLGNLFGFNSKQIGRKLEEIIRFAGLEEYRHSKMYGFSEGMKDKLIFSTAVHLEPKILLLDEVFAVGDEAFKNKSIKKIKELLNLGASVVLVSHELDLVENYCDRTIWIHNGEIKKDGNPQTIIRDFKKFFEKQNG